MDIGIFSKTFEGKIPNEILNRITQAGYSAVHYNLISSGMVSMPEMISQEHASLIYNTAKKYKLNLAGISGTFNMAHPDEEIRTKGLKRLRILASFAKEAKIPLISLCTGTRDRNDMWKYHPDNNGKQAWIDLSKTLEKSLTIAEDLNLDLGIEPEMANIINSSYKAKILLDQMQSSKLKIIMDPANILKPTFFNKQKIIIDNFINLLKDEIVMLHIKDLNKNGNVVAAGEGVIDFSYCVKKLCENDFNGSIITHGLTEKSAIKVFKHLKKILVYDL